MIMTGMQGVTKTCSLASNGAAGIQFRELSHRHRRLEGWGLGSNAESGSILGIDIRERAGPKPRFEVER